MVWRFFWAYSQKEIMVVSNQDWYLGIGNQESKAFENLLKTIVYVP